jgi:hypothetical protein
MNRNLPVVTLPNANGLPQRSARVGLPVLSWDTRYLEF